MAIYKRGKIYWYKFTWNGKAIRESTKQGNDKVARQMEAAHRTSLAKGEVGIREKKRVPTLAEFCTNRFEPWVKSSFEKTCPATWKWYKAGTRALLGYKPLAKLQLDEINSEHISQFVAHRQLLGLQVSYVNGSVRVLRRMLRLATEWRILAVSPRVELLPGEHRRERVITLEEEQVYLLVAPPLVAQIAGVLVDTGLRPDECYRLRWENVTWENGRNGSLLVTQGKTASARRVLPMTPRVRATLEDRWCVAGRPREGWVWPAPTHSGHAEGSSIKKQHTKAVKLSGVRPFVLYSQRHTFLTRLGASGCDAWTLARIAGHSSIAISSRYVHPSEEAVLSAMSRLGGHNSGHRGSSQSVASSQAGLQTAELMDLGGGPSRI
jgi:integrase